MADTTINREDAQRVLEKVRDSSNGDLLQGPVYGPHRALIERFIYAAAVDYMYNGGADPYAALDGFDAGVETEVWEMVFDEALVSTQEALVTEGSMLGIGHDRGECVREDAERAAIDVIRTAVEDVVGADPANDVVEFEDGCVTDEEWDAAYAAVTEATPPLPADVLSQVRARLARWELDPASATAEGMLAELRKIVG